MEKTMDKIIALAKARGFVYPGSEIYGGLANTWDYGNLGEFLLIIFCFEFSHPYIPPSLLPEYPSFPVFPAMHKEPCP